MLQQQEPDHSERISQSNGIKSKNLGDPSDLRAHGRTTALRERSGRRKSRGGSLARGEKKVARDLELHLDRQGTAGVERGKRQPRRRRAERPPQAEAGTVRWRVRVRGRSHCCQVGGDRESGGIFRRRRRRRRRRRLSVASRRRGLVDSVHIGR